MLHNFRQLSSEFHEGFSQNEDLAVDNLSEDLEEDYQNPTSFSSPYATDSCTIHRALIHLMCDVYDHGLTVHLTDGSILRTDHFCLLTMSFIGSSNYFDHPGPSKPVQSSKSSEQTWK